MKSWSGSDYQREAILINLVVNGAFPLAASGEATYLDEKICRRLRNS